MADAPNPLAAELAAIRENLVIIAELERAGGYEEPTRTLVHGQRLLAAVEAALARHQPMRSALRQKQTICGGCTYATEWPCPEYTAIAAALLGQDTAKGGSE